MTFTYDAVWKKISAALSDEIIAFWCAENALPGHDNLAKRAQQVVVVMRDGQGKIAAVSTAMLDVIPRLQQPLYYYRTFCAETQRNNRTSIPMMKASQQALLEYNLSLQEPESIGLHIEIENDFISSHYNMAFWPQTGFSFIGYSPRGLVARAYYFPDVALKPKPMA